MESLPFTIQESSSLFMDAYALDGDRWIFGSFWASETVLQEFFARLTLPNHEFGISALTLNHPTEGQHKRIVVGDAARLTKITAKTPAFTVVGSLCNAWIFDPALQKPDHGNGECYVLADGVAEPGELGPRVWGAIKELSSLPLLDHWKEYLLPILYSHEWIVPLVGFGVRGFRVSLPAEPFEILISEGVRLGRLALQVEPCIRQVVPTRQASLW